MKKLIAVILVAVLAFTGAVGYFLQRDKSAPADPSAPSYLFR